MSESEIELLSSILKDTQPFDYNYHNRVGENVRGVYSFWLRGCCLYVGISIDIKNRLWQHRDQKHNSNLEKYMHAFARNIEVSHVDLGDIDRKVLEDIESRLIQRMNPRANIQNKR